MTAPVDPFQLLDDAESGTQLILVTGGLASDEAVAAAADEAGFEFDD
ncbi:MAG: hypothetical protein QM809_00940 [Gordonia sp. (in: high G+C Gram-positive bacteria)]